MLPWRKRLQGRAPLGGRFDFNGSADTMRCRNTTKPRLPTPAMASVAKRAIIAGNKKEPPPPPSCVVGGVGLDGGKPVPPPLLVVPVAATDVGV